MLKPRIKHAHSPLKRATGEIWIGSLQYGLGTELSGADAALVWQLCERMDGSLTYEGLISQVIQDCPADYDSVRNVLDFLIGSGWVEDAGASPPDVLTAGELDRYRSSAQLLSWIDLVPRQRPYELQAMLKASRVTVLGLGGIGSATAISLAASGIGQLHCVDGDRVELSNLNRQVFYCEADIGRPKAAALLDKVRALNAGVAVTTADRMLSRPADIINEVSGSDIFVLSADHPKEIVSWANRCALELGIPWVSASYAGPMMAIATFIPGVTGCHRCAIEGKGRRDDLLQLQPLPGAEARISGYNPVMAPTALMTSQLAAMEVIYYLVGLKVQTAGRVLHRNFLDYDHQYYIEADRRPGCGDCGPTASRMRDSHASRQ